ncbi:DinB family protein [Nocardia cyriacigeorgica]|uniref:DinB family protein n=1 Tax=Nocardia cyriacigeorgica TaxID=135487 RepID=UPI001895D7E3|nr:DinB family protein [Nocardia cyriacigeorgica]MBF6100514.1 DinB family protein [Nocardia cyriacigeorgica]MBF6320348.1 DinB family protein [Nocardia cyriacigeorgica]MBF6534166.1 DinB family protein [Nocardia cyriacigeorgica]
MTEHPVDRQAIADGMERARATLVRLVEAAGEADAERPSAGTRWTNEQLLFHMVFGFMVVQRLLPLVRLFGRLPPRWSRTYARLLNVCTPLFDVINYRGSCAAAMVYNRHRVVWKFDRVLAALRRKLAAEPERNFDLCMAFPTRWDPFFADTMTLEQVYRYPIEHFDFHARQLTLTR